MIIKRRNFIHLCAAALAVSAFHAPVAHAAVTLRVGSEEPFSNPPRVAAQFGLDWLEANVAGRTNGQVLVKVSGNGALGPEKELLKSVSAGIIDGCVSSPGNAAALIPEFQLFSVSYLFSSFDHVMKVLENDAFFKSMQNIVRDRKLGMQLAGISVTGARNLYNRVRVVNGIDDMKGLKMRVMNSPTETKVWSSLGMIPASIPAPEIYSALQSGVVDAAESSIAAIVASKYYEVAPNLTLTNHQFNLMFYFIGDRALAKVPEAERAALMETFREAAIVQAKAAATLQTQSLEFLRNREGVTVTEIDTSAISEKLQPMQQDIAKGFKMEDILNLIIENDPARK